MTTPEDRDRELDALLRAQVETLPPPDGAWEQVARRARRRKWAKASVSVAAVVVIVAGAVPAVLAVRDNSDDQSLTLANPPSTSPGVTTNAIKPGPIRALSSSPTAVPTTLTGFRPTSLSFNSQTVGYLWGSTGSSTRGVVARTENEGVSWALMQAPPVNATAAGDPQIRFGLNSVGFVFGSSYYVTMDGGQSWTQYAAPGYIDDLETVAGRVWALVRPSKDSSIVRLYAATVGDPALQPVNSVHPMSGPQGADSIAVNDRSVDVIVGNSDFYSSPNGVTWRRGVNPCQDSPTLGRVETTLLTTLNLGGVVAACGYDQSGTSEDKRIFVSTKAGRSWRPTAANPASSGYLETFAAGTQNALIIGTDGGGAQITHDGGASWVPVSANGVPLGFVGFINLHRIVAVAEPTDTSAGGFASSNDTGNAWNVTAFPK